mgnify:CR=1 FL=1
MLKKELIEYISNLQDELLSKPLSVYDVCPDVVDTDMTKGLWEDLPKLSADDVAEAFYTQTLLKKTTANIITVDGGNIEASLR